MLKHADKLVSAILTSAIAPAVVFLLALLPDGLGAALTRTELLVSSGLLVAIGLLLYTILLSPIRSLIFLLFDPLGRSIGLYVEVYRFEKHIVFAPFGLFFDGRKSALSFVGHAFRTYDVNLTALHPEFHHVWRSTISLTQPNGDDDSVAVRYFYEAELNDGAGSLSEGVTMMILAPRGAGSGSFAHVGADLGRYTGFLVDSLDGHTLSREVANSLLVESSSALPRVKFTYFKLDDGLGSKRHALHRFRLNLETKRVCEDYGKMREIAASLSSNSSTSYTVMDKFKVDFQAKIRELSGTD